MPAPSRPSRSGSTSARNEVIDMLKADHKRAKKAFRDFEKLDAEEDAEQCRQIVEQTCAELTVHARLEEECFYPAARAALEEADLIDEAEVEHQSAKDLIEQLKGMSPGDDKYAARFTVLGEYIQHHAKEEETEMFPQLSRAKLDWQSLLGEMQSRRAELMQELMPEQAGAEAEDKQEAAATTPATTTRRRSSPAGGARTQRSRGSESRPQASTAVGQSDDED